MIPVMQTKAGGANVPLQERGDCLDACLASLLEVSIEEVPCPHGDDWWERAQESVASHGYRLVYVGPDLGWGVAQAAAWLGPVYWIAGVPSLNLGVGEDGTPVMHVIVMYGEEIVHDPSIGRGYPRGRPPEGFVVEDVILLVPLAIRSRRGASGKRAATYATEIGVVRHDAEGRRER